MNKQRSTDQQVGTPLAGDLTAVPIVDALKEVSGRNLASFHALPISGGKSLIDSAFCKHYSELIGQEFLDAELTLSGEMFDVPVLPKLVVRHSQSLTAQAFGAEATLYVTTGTTTSNLIAVAAMTNAGDRVLADRACHQSIHFALAQNQGSVTYIDATRYCEDSGRSFLDVPSLVEEYKKAALSNDPYRVVVLTAASYEGVLYDVKWIMKQCLQINDDVQFLVDEAWSSFGPFHPFYRRFSAMNAALELQAEMPQKKVCVAANQSVHKSLSCLRQGSYINIRGGRDLVYRFEATKFMLHTTSPSYPILASLELARAQAVLEGRGLIERALSIASWVKQRIIDDRRLSEVYTNGEELLSEDIRRFIHLDPLKLSINLSRLGQKSARAFKKFAFNEHGVFVNRVTNTSVLISVHIGVTWDDATRLLDALAEFQRLVLTNERSSLQTSSRLTPENRNTRRRTQPIEHIEKVLLDSSRGEQLDAVDLSSARKDANIDTHLESGLAISDCFVIPYPPGVPLVVPGDVVDYEIHRKLEMIRLSDAEIVKISLRNVPEGKRGC